MKVANCSVLLSSECVVDKEMRPKEAFPIALCLVMSLVGESGKGSSLPIGNSPLESGVEPRQHTPEPCLPFTLHVTTFLSPQGWSHRTRRVLPTS